MSTSLLANFCLVRPCCSRLSIFNHSKLLVSTHHTRRRKLEITPASFNFVCPTTTTHHFHSMTTSSAASTTKTTIPGAPPIKRDQDGHPLVYYLSYGSNIDSSRFLCYIQGGKPKNASVTCKGARNKEFQGEEHSHYIVFDNELMFGGPGEGFESSTWGGGGVCFVSPNQQEDLVEKKEQEQKMDRPMVKETKISEEPPSPEPRAVHGLVHRLLKIDEQGKAHMEYEYEEGTKTVEREFSELSKKSTIGRMYRVTWEQFLDTVLQENGVFEDYHLHDSKPFEEILKELTETGEVMYSEEGMYGKMLLLGFYQGCPILTFTHPQAHVTEVMNKKAPSIAYASTISRGLLGIPGMKTKHARDYLHEKHEHGHTVEELEKHIGER